MPPCKSRSALARRLRNFGPELFKTDDDLFWKADYDWPNYTELAYEPTKHVLDAQVFATLLHDNKVVPARMEANKAAHRAAGTTGCVARFIGKMHAWSEARTVPDRIAAIEIWSYHIGTEVRCIWPVQKLVTAREKQEHKDKWDDHRNFEVQDNEVKEQRTEEILTEALRKRTEELKDSKKQLEAGRKREEDMKTKMKEMADKINKMQEDMGKMNLNLKEKEDQWNLDRTELQGKLDLANANAATAEKEKTELQNKLEKSQDEVKQALPLHAELEKLKKKSDKDDEEKAVLNTRAKHWEAKFNTAKEKISASLDTAVKTGGDWLRMINEHVALLQPSQTPEIQEKLNEFVNQSVDQCNRSAFEFMRSADPNFGYMIWPYLNVPKREYVQQSFPELFPPHIFSPLAVFAHIFGPAAPTVQQVKKEEKPVINDPNTFKNVNMLTAQHPINQTLQAPFPPAPRIKKEEALREEAMEVDE